jgi:hypothetical protein
MPPSISAIVTLEPRATPASTPLHTIPEATRTGATLGDGAWLSLVERLLWEQDVGGSNPLAPTTESQCSTLSI